MNQFNINQILLNYFKKELSFYYANPIVESYIKNISNEKITKYILDDTMLGINSRLKNGVKIFDKNHKKEINEILNIIQNNDIIPDDYLLFTYMFFVRLDTLFFQIQDSKLLINDIGEENIIKIIEMGIELNLKIINKYNKLIQYIQDTNILGNQYPATIIFNRNFSETNIIDKHLLSLRNEIINCCYTNNIFHTNKIDMSYIKNKKFVTQVDYFILENREAIIPLIINNKTIIKNIQKLFIEYFKIISKIDDISVYFRIENPVIDYNKLYSLITSFIYLDKTPELILLFADNSNIDQFIDQIEHVLNNETICSSIYFSTNMFIKYLNEAIEYNKDKNNEAIDIINTIKSYFQLKDII